ncbi:MAG: glycosyltransferase family 39 protein [Oscillatoria princeps RMCB-10]|jgi:uncharacterized membrane protein|nr:glycosyltransferase family 39 protein [Oscillatoria princeps RMCB-10]
MTVRNLLTKIKNDKRSRFHLLLLLAWVAIGTGLRLTNLASKTPSTIELATLIFSLGNSVRAVPLERAIGLDTLLKPLLPNPDAGISEVVHHLLAESTHPPVYFALTHLWLKLFPADGGLVSLWAARCESALFGAASIPAVFGLGWLAFRSPKAGQMAAALMAVSPYGIFLAQEARHYTLPVLLIIASLCCLVTATRSVNSRTPLPIWVGLTWVGLNSLGLAVHYFFSLALAAEALVLLGFGIGELRREKFPPLALLFSQPWLRIYAVAAGTLAGGLVWLPALKGASDSELTRWIYSGNPFSDWLEPVVRVLAWVITMLSLLPVEGTPLPIAIASGLGMGVFLLWALPLFWRGIKIQMGEPAARESTLILGGFTLATVALVFGITYGLGADLTLAARYHFVYFPGVIVLLGSAIAFSLDDPVGCVTRSVTHPTSWFAGRKKAAAVILALGLAGGLTVVSNLGFQKSKRADLLVPIILQRSEVPVLIATAHKTHAETRAMIGLAWEFKHRNRLSAASNPQFLLAHKDGDSKPVSQALYRTLEELPRPLDLWAVNFTAAFEPAAQNCVADSKKLPKVAGYKYRLYHCK